MNTKTFVATIVSGFVLSMVSPVFSQQHPTMPAGMTHEEHLAQMKKEAEMKKRGEMAMGFDQDVTIHHFILMSDGGAIDVGVKTASDKTNRDAIRTHLESVAREFAKGDFEKPFMTHAEVPAGVPAMQKLKAKITYSYEKSDAGARVRIKTRDKEALEAVHEFLRYQIREHATGDPLTVKK